MRTIASRNPSILFTMRLLPLTLLGLTASAVGQSSSSSDVPSPTTPAEAEAAQPSPDISGLIDAAASDSSAIDAFFKCLWPTTDRVVSELVNLKTVDFDKLIDELHWEVLWWGHPEKWVPDLAGITLNVTFVAACVLDVVGQGLAVTGLDFTNELLKTLDLIPRNASNTDIPGLRK